jgi:hypothetical protein
MTDEVKIAFGEEIIRLKEENERLKTMIRHAIADRTGVYFICGEGGTKDSMGLPAKILVAPSYGADGFAVYSKTGEYSGPEW